MAKEKLKKSRLTAFTPNGDYMAVLSSKGTAKVWNTDSGDLLAECKPSDGDADIQYSCIACSFIGKKRRKEHGTCLLALGTVDGSVSAINVFTSERKWTASYPGGVGGLLFAEKGHLLRVVGLNGMAFEVNAETGELLKEFKISKKSISSLAFSPDEKFLAIVAGTKLQIISWENWKEVLKFPDGLENVHHVSISSDAKTLVTSDFEGEHIQVWMCDLNSGTVSSGPTLSVRHPPLYFECHHSCNEENNVVILGVSGSGAAHVWNLKASSNDEIHPTEITVKTKKGETDQQNSEISKKNRASIISCKLQPIEVDKQMTALVAYGSIHHPQFSVVNINNLGENITLNVAEETEAVNKRGRSDGKALPVESKNVKKRQAESDPDLPTTTDKVDFDVDQGELADAVLDDDANEPTMGEKLADLNLLDNNKSKSDMELKSSLQVMPPSADSVHVLLKQALHADDRTLLLDCLYTQDEKVISKSISQLSPSNVLNLLHSLISIIESRGALLACSLPWLKHLLLQHASGIMSQESSFPALNSLYQLIESRVCTFKSAVQLSSSLDILYSGVIDEEEVDEGETVPVIFEDKDSEEESEDAMDTDQNTRDEEEEQSGDEHDSDDGDVEGNDDIMSE